MYIQIIKTSKCNKTLSITVEIKVISNVQRTITVVKSNRITSLLCLNIAATVTLTLYVYIICGNKNSHKYHENILSKQIAGRVKVYGTT